MREHRPSPLSLTALILLFAASPIAAAGERRSDGKSTPERPRVVRIGAVAYAPSAVTIFEDIRRYFDRRGMSVDYVLFSHYDALVEALRRGEVDIAWNTPLAHAQYHRKAGNASQALVMRDVDCNVRSASWYGPTHPFARRMTWRARRWSSVAARPPRRPCCRSTSSAPGGELRPDQDPQPRRQCRPARQPVLQRSARAGRAQEGKGQAGIIGERFWKHLSEREPDRVSGLKVIWVSPPFSHCVFTASKDFDKDLAARFTRLMLAMDPSDPLAAEAMRLEGTRRWVAGSQEGFQELLKALDESPACGPSACECCTGEGD